MPPKAFAHGLVVGKFSPLHLGHELLIHRALAECEAVTVISWSQPVLDGCGLARRRRWLQSRFPQEQLPIQHLVIDQDELDKLTLQAGVPPRKLPHNLAPDLEPRELVAWLCDKLLKIAPDAVFTSESYGDGFAAHLTGYFQQAGETLPPVVHRCVDQARSLVPISGTEIRANPHAHRNFMAPDVYGDFVERVVFLGGESTGKTTLAAALARKYATQWAAEYGRELWDQKSGQLCFDDMLRIARTQIAREAQLAKTANRYLFCDSSPLTTLFYSLKMFGKAAPDLEQLARRNYHWVFLCAADFPFVQDGTRQSEAFRREQQHWYEQQLAARAIPYTLVTGSLQDRLEQVAMALSGA